MTAIEIINKSLSLLGYSDSNNNADLTQRVLNRALPLINLVYEDICRMCGLPVKEIVTLSQDLELPQKADTVMACGLASYIAAAEGDDGMQSFWAAEYASRKTTLTQVTEYTDAVPTPEY